MGCDIQPTETPTTDDTMNLQVLVGKSADADFLREMIGGDWPYVWVDATYLKVRQAGRIVSVAVTIAVGVNGDGRREVLGMAIGASEAETFWTDFLRSLARRGLRGVKLIISDAHDGIKAAVSGPVRNFVCGRA